MHEYQFSIKGDRAIGLRKDNVRSWLVLSAHLLLTLGLG